MKMHLIITILQVNDETIDYKDIKAKYIVFSEGFGLIKILFLNITVSAYQRRIINHLCARFKN